MGMARHVALSVQAIIAVAALLAPRASGYPWPVCGNTGSFAANGTTYLASISTIAATLPRNASASPGLYATAQVGQVWALALCRGDADATSCYSCLAQAFQDLPSACPYSKDATMYYESCFLHYSNLHFHSSEDTALDSAYPLIYSFKATAEPARFVRVVATLLNATADYAAYNSSSRLYASGVVAFDQEIPEVYSWAQCTPDLTPARCRDCLANIMDWIGTPYSLGARALGIRCSFRYETRPFLDGPVMMRLPATSAGSGVSAPPPAPAPVVVPNVVTPVAAAGGGKKRSSVAGISASIAFSVVLTLILSVFAFIRLRRRIKDTEHDNPLKKISKAQCTIFDLTALQEATENFSQKNKLGEGGFGIVYKGILPAGQEIAVKKLLGRGGHGLHQLQNEVLVLADLQHKNLVKLQGFCSHQDDTLLVYEYIKNGSLDNFLSGTSKGNTLSWEQQYNIIIGIAKGILYLHEDSSTRIIHRDLKPSNILLDEHMDPKIADFGLSRLLGEGHTHTRTARAVGTLGYMAPEYATHGHVSTKMDIFSFGVLVLQIVARRRNCSSDDPNNVNFLSEVWNHLKKGTISQMMGQPLDEQTRNQQLRCIHIGLMCVQSDPGDRPDISSAIFMLSRDDVELQPPEEPAFFFGSESTSVSPSYNRPDFILGKDISVNRVTITEPYPR